MKRYIAVRKRSAVTHSWDVFRLPPALLILDPRLIIEISRLTAAAIDVPRPGTPSLVVGAFAGRKAVNAFAEGIPDFMLRIVAHVFPPQPMREKSLASFAPPPPVKRLQPPFFTIHSGGPALRTGKLGERDLFEGSIVTCNCSSVWGSARQKAAHEPLPRGEQRVCKRSGCLRGDPAAGRVAAEAGRKATPKRAEGRALRAGRGSGKAKDGTNGRPLVLAPQVK